MKKVIHFRGLNGIRTFAVLISHVMGGLSHLTTILVSYISLIFLKKGLSRRRINTQM